LKIVGETTCPNCKKDHEAAFDVDNMDIKKVEVPIIRNATVQGGQETIQQIKEVEKIVEKFKVPSNIPKYKCKNCDKNHKNKDYHEPPKFKCANCGQFSSSGDECIWCDGKEFDELDEDELEDLGIPEPKEEEHDHEA
jgi:hypothetical protein